MYQEVLGTWPTHNRFILISCDDQYLNKYFPRFYKTFTRHWKLAMHVHVIDPSDKSLRRLDKLNVSYTFCKTKNSLSPIPYVTYCQAQRFILLGFKALEGQSIIVADVDAYALKTPSQSQIDLMCKDMAFTTYNSRLMATFCHFHSNRRQDALDAAKKMIKMLKDTDNVGVDQKVIKEIFGRLPYTELTAGEWIRHHDVKTQQDIQQHQNCLVYHEKGTRGKDKGPQVKWTDIE